MRVRAVATMVWSSAASSMPSTSPDMMARIWRWVYVRNPPSDGGVAPEPPGASGRGAPEPDGWTSVAVAMKSLPEAGFERSLLPLLIGTVCRNRNYPELVTTSPPLDRRKQRAVVTRRAIRRAALELVAEHGLDAVNVEQIAERADVGYRTFFNHFACKEDALVEP